MNVFDATEVINETRESIAFLQELLEQQKKLLALQQELETLLQDAAKFDPLDHESKGIQEKIEEVSNQLQKLTTPSEVKGTSLKARDLVPVLLHSLDAPIYTLISVHCGTPQPGTYCGASKDGDVFIC
jgi:hypothetical protein